MEEVQQIDKFIDLQKKKWIGNGMDTLFWHDSLSMEYLRILSLPKFINHN